MRGNLFYIDGIKPEELIKEHLQHIPGGKRDRVVIRGTEIKVHGIIDMLGAGWTYDDIIKQHPAITSEQIRACCAYAYLICQIDYEQNSLGL